MKKPRRKNGLIAVILIFLILAIIGFITGANMLGWDILSWFISKQAFLVYTVGIALGFFIAFNIWKGRQER